MWGGGVEPPPPHIVEMLSPFGIATVMVLNSKQSMSLEMLSQGENSRTPNRLASSVTSFLICLVSLHSLAACEEELDPLAPIDGVFSINGYLDAAADTQWVRVTPFRTTILTTPDPVDAVVTLEHLETGRIVEMHSTVFTFPSPNFAGEASYGHNFWTDEPIERGASYRLTARRSDGESASALVKIPSGLIDSEVWVGVDDTARFTDGSHQLVYLRFDIQSGDHLAFLSFDQYRKFPHACSARPIDHTLYPPFGERPAGPLTYPWGPIRRDIRLPDLPPCDLQHYLRWTASIVLSGERWPVSPGDFVGDLDLGSNVENGMGYLGGVVWEKIPVPFCALVGTGAPELCELFFGPETATLDVQVRDPDDNLLKKTFNTINAGVPLRVRLSRSGETWYRSGDIYPFVEGEPLDYVPDLPLTIIRFPGLLPGEYRITFPGHVVSLSPDIETYCEERTVLLLPGEHRVLAIQTVVQPPVPTEPVNANGCREG
jgi:hypothetical protein